MPFSFIYNTCSGLCSLIYLAKRRTQCAPLLSPCYTNTSEMSDTCDKGNSVILQLLIAIVIKQGETYTSKSEAFFDSVRVTSYTIRMMFMYCRYQTTRHNLKLIGLKYNYTKNNINYIFFRTVKHVYIYLKNFSRNCYKLYI